MPDGFERNFIIKKEFRGQSAVCPEQANFPLDKNQSGSVMTIPERAAMRY